MTAINTDIPAGFERHFRQSPLTEPWEPLYSRRTDKAVIIGLRLTKPHTNGRGLIHGGLIATLADNGVEACFANPGTSEMQFVAALDRKPEMRPVLCLFEGVATGAADGYGRMAEP